MFFLNSFLTQKDEVYVEHMYKSSFEEKSRGALVQRIERGKECHQTFGETQSQTVLRLQHSGAAPNRDICKTVHSSSSHLLHRIPWNVNDSNNNTVD